ncbi:MAG: glycosyltransferase [Brumimicrobium sp.]
MIDFYLLFLICCFLFFIFLKISKSKQIKENQISLNEVVVIIPFRNEMNNLPLLLNSIKTQTKLPKDIFFINDHSTDSSVQLIEEFISANNIGSLFHLNDDKMGKKEALLVGIENLDSKYALTMDADVVLNEKYFETLSFTPETDLLVLPVIPKGKGFLSNLFSTEYLFLSAFNYLLQPIYPISASGANLLINLNEIDYKEQLSSHQSISSGDDYFLMQKVRSEKQRIFVNNQKQLSVVTSSPNSFKEYFHQRIRWIGKANVKPTISEYFFGIFIIFYFLSSIVTLVFLALMGWIEVLVVIFTLRLVLDTLIFTNYTIKLQESWRILYLPLFQIVYFLLMISTMVGSFFYQPKWKGRLIQR